MLPAVATPTLSTNTLLNICKFCKVDTYTHWHFCTSSCFCNKHKFCTRGYFCLVQDSKIIINIFCFVKKWPPCKSYYLCKIVSIQNLKFVQIYLFAKSNTHAKLITHANVTHGQKWCFVQKQVLLKTDLLKRY